jgi:hypothetical protein
MINQCRIGNLAKPGKGETLSLSILPTAILALLDCPNRGLEVFYAAMLA